MTDRDAESPLKRLMQVAIVLFFMPALIFSAWQKARDFDPYAEMFFTKTYVEPTLDMPGEMRIAAWVLIAIGALVAFAGLSGFRKPDLSRTMSFLVLLLGAEVMAFGATFFIGAASAEQKIAARQAAVQEG